MNCNICNKPYGGDSDHWSVKGIEIRNYCLDNLPPVIIICRSCAEDFAIKVLTGNINTLKLMSMFKLFKGK